MGYEALLFCPDEKTARTVTQVLSELEFSVEACMEPFAAVKKLMGQHFDAVVVDCDNEQNATLLFKSARNSTSNQASLAVAVVEGQAGVAKAFRIGANLVLTKPINIEQAKGTLRVARGLLRKGEPGKPAVAAAAPAKPVAAKPVAPAKPAVPATLAAATAPRSAAPPVVKPEVKAAWPTPAAAAAKSVPAAQDDDLLDIGDDSVPAPAVAAPILPANVLPASHGANPALTTGADVRSAFHPGVTGLHGSGAASAPAPAREAQDSHVAEKPATSTAADALFEKPAEAAHAGPSGAIGSEPTFTFGGSNLPEKSSGASKKILLGLAAAAIVTAALYVGLTQFKGRTSEPASVPTPVASAPVAPAAAKKPSGALPALPTAPAPKPTTAASSPSLQPAVTPKNNAVDNSDSASDDTTSSAPSSNLSAADKTEAAAPAPLIVKGGRTGAKKAAAAADAPAPSMEGIATTGAGAPPPDLVSSTSSAPKPILQTMNISQGVSRGLLIKKVQPAYPTNALALRLEGAVELLATISKTGDITHVKVLSGDQQLTRAATDAVKQWKYKPYLLNGEPVEIQTQITINFKLPK
jgi:protein TonB